MTENPFVNPAGAFKDGKLVHAWRSWPDAFDAEGIDFDYIRPLNEPEINALKDSL